MPGSGAHIVSRVSVLSDMVPGVSHLYRKLPVLAACAVPGSKPSQPLSVFTVMSTGSLAGRIPKTVAEESGLSYEIRGFSGQNTIEKAIAVVRTETIMVSPLIKSIMKGCVMFVNGFDLKGEIDDYCRNIPLFPEGVFLEGNTCLPGVYCCFSAPGGSLRIQRHKDGRQKQLTFSSPVKYLNRLLPYSAPLLFAAVVLPRLLWFTYLHGELPQPGRDQALYIYTAGRIASGEGLSFSSVLATAKRYRNTADSYQQIWTENPEYAFGLAPVETPTAVMEPGYSVLLAVFFRLFGGVTGAVFALNMIFSLLGAFAVRKLAGDAWGPLSGMTASLLWALYPPYVYYSAYAMTETAHFSLLMISLMLLFSCGRGKGTGFLAGLATGVFFLIRATALFLLPLEMAYLAWRKKWRQLAFILAGFTVAVSPWVIRNAVELGSPVLMPTKGSLNLWMRNHPGVLAMEGIHVPEDIPVNSPELLVYPSTDSIPGELERSSALASSAREFMMKNPRLLIWLAWQRACDFLSPGGDTLGDRARSAGLMFYGIMLFGAVGIWRNRRSPETVFLFSVFVFYLLLHTAAHGGVRYRLPVDSVFLLGIAMCSECGKGSKCQV